MVRKVYFSEKHTAEYKLHFLKKYIVRLSRNILLFKNITSYDHLDTISADQLLEILKQHNLLAKDYDWPIDDSKTIEYYYGLFCEISVNLIDCKKELDSKKF